MSQHVLIIYINTLINLSIITDSSGGAKGDMDYKKLLSKGVRQCLSTAFNHHTGEPLQVQSAFHTAVLSF